MNDMDSKSNSTLFLLTNHPNQTQPPPSSSDLRPPSRRRDSRTPSFSSSVSSLSSSPSSFSTSSSPSPFHCLLHPSSIPFSWERRPGIPKSPSSSSAAAAASDGNPLPLPPPLRSVSGISQKKRSDSAVDPFAAALVECAKDAPVAAGEGVDAVCPSGKKKALQEVVDAVWWRRSADSGEGEGKRTGIWRRAINGDIVGAVGLFASCKTACSVSDTRMVVPRARVRAAGSYRLLKQRSK